MSAAKDFIQASVARAKDSLDASSSKWLNEYRSAQLALARDKQVPRRGIEHFKYNNLTSLNKESFAKAPSTPAKTVQLPTLASELEADRIVIIDGVVSNELSTLDRAHVTSFSDATDAQQSEIKSILERKDNELNVFSLVNASISENGWLIEFSAAETANPLHIIYVNTDQSKSCSLHEQLVVKLNASAKATVIEHFVSDMVSPTDCVQHQTAHYNVGDNAHLEHYRLHLEADSQIHFGETNFWLNRDSQLKSFHLSLGSIVKRNDINVFHQQQGSHADLNGVYLAQDNQQVDYHTNVEHRVPHCTSQEIFRGLIGGKAKAVFNGRIHIYQDAQKTLAELSNKNLLLSNTAEVNTKPELEIYADDVQCAHGATVAQLDKTSLFYLQSRGIPRQQAELMISFGFVNELVDGLNQNEVADYLRPIVSQFFNSMTE